MKEAALCTRRDQELLVTVKLLLALAIKKWMLAVGAGAVAGAYGDPALLPLGVTYTHASYNRKTVYSKTSDEAGEMLKTNNGDVCRTVANADEYGTSESARKYTHKRALDEGTGSASAETRVYLMNHGDNQVITCVNSTCGGLVGTATAGSDCTYCAAQKSDLDSDDDSTVLIYALTKPYTVTTKPPKVTMKFGTAEALSANDVTGTVCNIWAEEPVFTATIE